MGADGDLGQAVAELAGTTGLWLAETLIDAAPHIPVRDQAALRAQFGRPDR